MILFLLPDPHPCISSFQSTDKATELCLTTTKISFIGCCLFAYQSIKIFDKRQLTNIGYYDHPFLPSSLDNEKHRGVRGVSFTPEQELFAVRNCNGDLNEIVEQFQIQLVNPWQHSVSGSNKNSFSSK